MRRFLTTQAFPIGFLVLIAVGWHLLTRERLVSPLILPPLTQTLSDFFRIVSQGLFIPDFLITAYEVSVGFSIAAVTGCTVGFFVGRSRYWVKVFNPLFSSLFAVPSVLLYPLFVLFFGLGPASKIAIASVFAFFPIVLNTVAGLAYVDRSYITAARSMGANQRQMFFNVMLPAALPVIINGLRIGLILCFLTVLGTEQLASYAGLGRQIVHNAELLNISGLFAYVLIILCISFLLNTTVTAIERKGRRYME